MKYLLPNNIIHDVDNETHEEFLLNMENGMIISLNEGAIYVIQQIISGLDMNQIITDTISLSEEEILWDDVQKDFMGFVNQLIENGFLKEEHE